MKSEARYIELVLENVETIIIDINDIESMFDPTIKMKKKLYEMFKKAKLIK